MAENDAYFDRFFERSEDYYRRWLGDLAEDPEAVIAAAKLRFLTLGPTLAYADDRSHTMAFSLFSCASLLCLYMELRNRGVDAHAFGARMLKALTDAAREARADREAAATASGEPDLDALRSRVELLSDQGARSQSSRKRGEFEFDVRWEDEASGRWDMTMSSCGICHLFRQHEAMDLVPYMCATDDVMSDMGDEGLSRTGTIALGSSNCDFHYQPGRPADHLQKAYPEQIRLVED